jgi:hypothetical protein
MVYCFGYQRPARCCAGALCCLGPPPPPPCTCCCGPCLCCGCLCCGCLCCCCGRRCCCAGLAAAGTLHPGNSPISAAEDVASASGTNCSCRPTASCCACSGVLPLSAASLSARSLPLSQADCRLAPVSQSPHTPTRAAGSSMQGTLGLLRGKAAPHNCTLQRQQASNTSWDVIFHRLTPAGCVC